MAQVKCIWIAYSQYFHVKKVNGNAKVGKKTSFWSNEVQFTGFSRVNTALCWAWSHLILLSKLFPATQLFCCDVMAQRVHCVVSNSVCEVNTSWAMTEHVACCQGISVYVCVYICLCVSSGSWVYWGSSVYMWCSTAVAPQVLGSALRRLSFSGLFEAMCEKSLKMSWYVSSPTAENKNKTWALDPDLNNTHSRFKVQCVTFMGVYWQHQCLGLKPGFFQLTVNSEAHSNALPLHASD